MYPQQHFITQSSHGVIIHVIKMPYLDTSEPSFLLVFFSGSYFSQKIYFHFFLSNDITE